MSGYGKEKGTNHPELGLDTPSSLSKENTKSDVVDMHSNDSIARQEGVKPAFVAKVGVLSNAIAEAGMGRYQWDLFITAGECNQVRQISEKMD